MKKIVSVLLALSMVFGVSTITRAEEVVPQEGLTQVQKEARQNYLPIHLEKMKLMQ